MDSSLKPYYIVLREHFIQVSILSTSQTTLKPLRKSYKKQRQGNFLYILSSGKWVQCLSCMKSLQILQESRILLLPAEPVGYKNIHSKNSVERTAQSYTPLLSSVLNHAQETFQRNRPMHIIWDRVFPQWMQQLSHSFCTIPRMKGIAWCSCERPVNTPCFSLC